MDIDLKKRIKYLEILIDELEKEYVNLDFTHSWNTHQLLQRPDDKEKVEPLQVQIKTKQLKLLKQYEYLKKELKRLT